MAKVHRAKSAKRDLYAGFGDSTEVSDEDADLPKDEAGRRKIKRQYQELLGIRIEKLKGRISTAKESIRPLRESISFASAVRRFVIPSTKGFRKILTIKAIRARNAPKRAPRPRSLSTLR